MSYTGLEHISMIYFLHFNGRAPFGLRASGWTPRFQNLESTFLDCMRMSKSHYRSHNSSGLSFCSLCLGTETFCYHSYPNRADVKIDLIVRAPKFNSHILFKTVNRQSVLPYLTLSHIWASS
jgi:hypothetical protein